MIAALLTTLLFATTAVCATQAALAFGAVRANFGRLAIAVVLLGIWAHLFGNGFGGGALGLFVVAGAIGFGGGGWCMFQAFPRLGSTLSLLSVECAAAILSLVAARIFLGVGISWVQLGAVGAILAGLVFALGPYRAGEVGRRPLYIGVLFACLAATGQSLSWILSKVAFIQIAEAGSGTDPLSAAYQRLLGGVAVAGLVLLLTALWRADLGTGTANASIFAGTGTAKSTNRPGWGAILRGQALQNSGLRLKAGTGNAGTGTAIRTGSTSGRAWLWIVGNAIAGPVLGVSCMLWAIREVGNPGLVQSIVATATLFTVPLARGLEEHRFGWNYYLGFAVAITGVAGLLLDLS